MNLIIAMVALMPAVAFLMPLSIDDTNTQLVAAVAKRQLDPAIQAKIEVLHGRTPPEDLSYLPTDLAVLKKMFNTYASIVNKAANRVETVQSSQATAPLSAFEYSYLAQKYYEEIQRVQARMDQEQQQNFFIEIPFTACSFFVPALAASKATNVRGLTWLRIVSKELQLDTGDAGEKERSQAQMPGSPDAEWKQCVLAQPGLMGPSLMRK
ncbi:hypothetical protein V8E36_007286 [Tilletia maclaganii]